MAMEQLDLTPRPDSVYFAVSTAAIRAIRALSILFSSLSLIGACAVIVSRWCSNVWRNKAVKNILAMLSVADIIVAISHIWGSSQNLEKFIDPYYPINHTDISTTDTQCTAQAVLAIFGTVSSFMWTLALVLFVLCVQFGKGCINLCQKPAVFITFSGICWGFPLTLMIVLARLYLLGYAESIDIGWCYVSLKTTSGDVHNIDYKIALLLGYEMWTWLIIFTIIICLLLYLVVHCVKQCYIGSMDLHADNKITTEDDPNKDKPITSTTRLLADQNDNGVHASTPQQEMDMPKLNCRPILAGFLLLLLRLPSTVVDIAVIIDPHQYTKTWLGLFVAFGAALTSSQGLVNAILFVFCTPQVRGICKRDNSCGKQTSS